MTSEWFAHSLAIGLLLAGAARTLDGALRLRRMPGRWVWLASLLGTLLLAVSAMRTGVPTPAAATSPAAAITEAVNAPAPRPAWSPGWLLSWMSAAVEGPTRVAGRMLRPLPEGLLLGGWAAASAAVLFGFGAAQVRTHRLRRQWPRAVLHDVPVRISPDAGPLVAGIVHPEIVLPHWLFAAATTEQRLILAHEREHVRARDPAVIALGALVAVLMPWHPAVWWMIHRLRLAVEMDCDARVLRHGAGRGAYGSVLLDVATRRTGLALAAPALLNPPSQLERRLRAMTASTPRLAALRSTGLTALTAGLVLAACEAEVPTAAEIADMDVAAAEARLHGTFAELGEDPNASYLIDGREATADEARVLEADRIAAIEVKRLVRPDQGIEKSIVHVWTHEGAAARAGTAEEGGVRLRRTPSADGPPEVLHLAGDDVLILIDGRKADRSRLRALSPDEIASVEVLKGAAAVRMHDDPAAANGIIRIVTRAGTARQK